jgi:hypothetical protein
MGTKRIIQRINKTKGWFFEVINKVDRPLSKLTKNKTEKKQINKIREKMGILQQTPVNSRESLGTILKIYSIINWNI